MNKLFKYAIILSNIAGTCGLNAMEHQGKIELTIPQDLQPTAKQLMYDLINRERAFEVILNSCVSNNAKIGLVQLFHDERASQAFLIELNRRVQIFERVSGQRQENKSTYKIIGSYAVMEALLNTNIKSLSKNNPIILANHFSLLHGHQIPNCQAHETYMLHEAIKFLDLKTIERLIEKYGRTIIAQESTLDYATYCLHNAPSQKQQRVAQTIVNFIKVNTLHTN